MFPATACRIYKRRNILHPTAWKDCRFSVVYSFYPRHFFKSCGFCRLLLAKLPAVFLMTRAFFTPPFLAFQIMFRDRSGSCFFKHSRPWSEPFFEASIYTLFLFPFAGGASLLPPPAVRIYKDVCFISGSNCRKNGKSDDSDNHRFCDKSSLCKPFDNFLTSQLPAMMLVFLRFCFL